MIEHPSLSAIHRDTANRFGPRVALRFKRDGLYHDISWGTYRSMADDLAAGLISLGVQTGDRFAILSENRFEWLISDIAILASGAVNVPLHAPLTPSQVLYQLQHSGSRGVFVGNQNQLDKVSSIRDQLPDLEWIVSFEHARSDRCEGLSTWLGLLGRGRRYTRHSDEVEPRERTLTRADLASIIYTSGTTGPPKGVMLTHGNLLSNAEATVRSADSSPSDVLLSWLPYSHIYARTCDHLVTNCIGSTVCLAESIDTLLVNLAEIQPTDFTSVPRFYEKVWSVVRGFPFEERKQRLQHIFGPRIRRLSSGGAPLPGQVAMGFFEAGLPLLEGYGLTESSPVISFNRRDSFQIGSVGQAVDGVEIRIADDGEILTSGPHVMKGYWNDPDSTRQCIRDGWLHTGDIGILDGSGFLRITDRKKDLIITSGGKNIAPSELERILVNDPYIDQSVIFGDGRPFLSALIMPNLTLLAAKAKELNCTFELEGDLIRSEELRRFLMKRVASVMEQVSKPERVKAILVLGRALQVEAEEMTPTLKIRRGYLIEKFKADFAEIYAVVEDGRISNVYD